MKIIKEEGSRTDTLKLIAQKMLIAARTAPKGRGADNIVMAVVEKPAIKEISEKLKELGEKHEVNSFLRDAGNILSADVMVLIGTRIKPIALKKCGLCGFMNCAEKEKHKDIPCAFNTGDLGIAICSAVSVAADHRVDNRIMYTVGLAVRELGVLGEDVKIIYAIPMSAASKNPFFDR